MRGKDDCRRGCRFPGCVCYVIWVRVVCSFAVRKAQEVFFAGWVGGVVVDWTGVVLRSCLVLEWTEGEGGERGKGNRNETGGEKATDRGDGTSEPRLY